MDTIDLAASTTRDHGTLLVPFRNLTAEGLRRVRQMYAALVPTRATLESLFALDAAQTAPTENWLTFFVEVASAHVIWDERPTGRVSEEDARWLLAQFDRRPSASTLAVLTRVVEEAPQAPAWMQAAVRHRACAFDANRDAAAPQPRPGAHLRLVA